VKRTTGRVVIDPDQGGFDPGTRVSGVLHRFGHDMATGRVIVTYDATATRGGTVQNPPLHRHRPGGRHRRHRRPRA
jgi:hypothetical protein